MVPAKRRTVRMIPVSAVALLGLLGLAVAVTAQIEGGDRGIPPIDTSGSFEVSGIDVDVAAPTADAARLGAWRIAQRRAWALLWERTHGSNGGAPKLNDAQLDGIVSAVVVDDEQIGPKRYVAKLGVLFDRARAGQILGVSGRFFRSAPMLVLPVEWSGGGPHSFEAKTDWQKAWARFRAGNSTVDYVRPVGNGADPLLLTAGQAQRPERRWWRGLLDQYGAADVLIPVVELQRLWPGGPVIGRFSARHGPDNVLLDSFSLRAATSDALPAMLDEGIRRIDRIYALAFASGQLRPDPSLIIETPVVATALVNQAEGEKDTPADDTAHLQSLTQAGSISTYTVQFDTPDVSAVIATESAVKAIPGVGSANTSSLALGGTSVMRVSFAGDLETLRLALQARGFRVEQGNGSLRIRRIPAP